MNHFAIKLSLLWGLLASMAVGQTSVRPSVKLDLRKGVNFGNMLEAPFEGAWGLTVEERFFDKVVEGGFTHIRLPVSWTHYAAQTAPYTIPESIFQRVDWCIEQARIRGLNLVLNNHHYDELNDNPLCETERALAIWEQIAERYQNQRRFLAFELLNEPHGVFNSQPQLWNDFFAAALSVVRETNPTRQVLVGPVGWNSIGQLENLELPDDQNLIVTVHYYSPFAFTHQGATWIDPVPPLGELWFPDYVGFAGNWQNWSWNTEVARGPGGLQVDYVGPWAGLLFHAEAPVSNVTQLKFTFDKATNIRVRLENDDHEQVVDMATQDGMTEYTVDVAGLGPDAIVTDVTIQHLSPEPLAGVTVGSAELLTSSGSQPLVATQAENVDNDFAIALAFRNQTGLPMYLGEFGAYELGDYASRVRYTETVREAARRRRFGWAYWEFGAGFGIFNPEDDTWNQELLEALIPN